MALITKDMIINDVTRKHPQTLRVFAQFKVDSCCGGACSIETTAKADGVDVDKLLKELNNIAVARA
ncbi:MAG TPA: DUF542 domain-containing protein [Candidatus Avalokitesvara rifleensis]|uniref:DUF542 domain-containing protein n=1 Tax=Candidatus Avalokitesvara rifleensis TaxID=3367620 RepID=UPI002713A8B9|nr:DUF542 domain-containing protein [Candidatus Brocadiales bacterium]